MTTTRRSFRFLAPLLGLALSLPLPAAAQRFGVAVGYSRMTGQIGSSQSDEGLAVRAGVDLNPGSVIRFGFEAGMERQNEARWTSQSACVLPGGGQGTCHFDSRERDTGWSLAALLRAGPRSGTLRPYALAGVQFLTVRTHGRAVVTDGSGAHLPNFEYDATYGDDALGTPLGAGLLVRPRGSPIAVMLEGRTTVLLHNYSGGMQLDWSPSLVLGIRFGR